MSEKGLISLEELQKASENAIKTKEASEESLDTYKRGTQMLNTKWEAFESSFKGAFEQFDANEVSRVGFLKRQIKVFLSEAGRVFVALEKERNQKEDDEAHEKKEMASDSILTKIKNAGIGSSLKKRKLTKRLISFSEFEREESFKDL